MRLRAGQALTLWRDVCAAQAAGRLGPEDGGASEDGAASDAPHARPDRTLALEPAALAALLHVYLAPPPHTSHSLAAALDLSTQTVDDALGRLAGRNLLAVSSEDGRIARTVEGAGHLEALAATIVAKAAPL